jgi:hypothetical protein
VDAATRLLQSPAAAHAAQLVSLSTHVDVDGTTGVGIAGVAIEPPLHTLQLRGHFSRVYAAAAPVHCPVAAHPGQASGIVSTQLEDTDAGTTGAAVAGMGAGGLTIYVGICVDSPRPQKM